MTFLDPVWYWSACISVWFGPLISRDEECFVPAQLHRPLSSPLHTCHKYPRWEPKWEPKAQKSIPLTLDLKKPQKTKTKPSKKSCEISDTQPSCKSSKKVLVFFQFTLYLSHSVVNIHICGQVSIFKMAINKQIFELFQYFWSKIGLELEKLATKRTNYHTVYRLKLIMFVHARHILGL